MTCQNSACQYYLIEEGKDIVKNGKTSAGHQQYFCKHCQTYFVETKNMPLYHACLDRREVEIICRHSMEKAPIRGVARVTILSGHRCRDAPALGVASQHTLYERLPTFRHELRIGPPQYNHLHLRAPLQ
ncbi:IS1/IS1595 family N-terminal zinc-binding domain-containing protein [Methanoculleus bourgensis]|uniref:IS1/IS1595 family N-terminal zinc-binding domain-containing protein n=1 Tax=Methanoculleus bourgensis TaxID=83986 RepID=UPI003CD0C6BD